MRHAQRRTWAAAVCGNATVAGSRSSGSLSSGTSPACVEHPRAMASTGGWFAATCGGHGSGRARGGALPHALPRLVAPHARSPSRDAVQRFRPSRSAAWRAAFRATRSRPVWHARRGAAPARARRGVRAARSSPASLENPARDRRTLPCPPALSASEPGRRRSAVASASSGRAMAAAKEPSASGSPGEP
jgi:hypothetical protein